MLKEQRLSHSAYSTVQIAQLFFLASLRVYSQQISTAKEKNSTDASAASTRFSISDLSRDEIEIQICVVIQIEIFYLIHINRKLHIHCIGHK